MNYSDHNFIETAQQTKLRVTLVVSSKSSQSSSTSRARRVKRVEPCCSTSSTQPKCMGSTRRTYRVETSQVEFGLITSGICFMVGMIYQKRFKDHNLQWVHSVMQCIQTQMSITMNKVELKYCRGKV